METDLIHAHSLSQPISEDSLIKMAPNGWTGQRVKLQVMES